MTPDVFTIKEMMLAVDDGHELYVQCWGNEAAEETIIFLHGGPGSGCTDSHKTLFDPRTQKVVFFDQRGCGKSTPHGSLKNNETDALVEDINVLAKTFGLKTFALIGGSWGSCLALVYGIRHPERVTRMVLRGIFTSRKSEVKFLVNGRFRAFFPEAWEAFVQSVPKEFRDDPHAYHVPRVLGSDAKAAKESAFANDVLESSVMRLDDRISPKNFEDFDPVGAIIECHYTANGCFIPENYILDNAGKLTMPVKLIQGRFDAVCPPTTAYELSKKLPNGQLFWTTAGHSGGDRANWELTRALLAQ